MIVGPHGFGFITGFSGTATASYSDLILDDNPIAYWTFNEQSGTTAADQVGSNTLTHNGDYTIGEPGPIAGEDSYSIQHGGAGAWSELTNTISKSGDHTVECWVFFKAGTPIDFNNEVMREDGGAACQFNFGGQVSFFDGSEEVLNSPDDSVVKDTWHLVHYKWESGELTFWVDGEKVATATDSSDYTWARTAKNNQKVIDQKLSDLAVYDRALTSTEIQEHYDAGVGN